MMGHTLVRMRGLVNLRNNQPESDFVAGLPKRLVIQAIVATQGIALGPP